jgi:hypothetical protein
MQCSPSWYSPPTANKHGFSLFFVSLGSREKESGWRMLVSGDLEVTANSLEQNFDNKKK